MKLFGTNVFIFGFEKTNSTRSCSKHLVCGGIVARGWRLSFDTVLLIMMSDQMNLVLFSMK